MERPDLVNPQHEMVKPGTEKQVGLWLLGVSASIFGIVVLGGYTRLTNSGLSMVKWKPQGGMPPKTEEAWEKEFEQYKQFPEYKVVNYDMSVKDFKSIYMVEWSHRMLGRAIGGIFFFPLTYFWARGYFTKKMKIKCALLFGLGGLQGFIGWWMVKSGLKEKTTELDKRPRVSPYRLTMHATMAYTLFSLCLWNAMTLLRRPQESYVNLNNISYFNIMRKSLKGIAHAFVLVYLLGFFVAGNDAAKAIVTFPKVGEHWFPKTQHLHQDASLWRNLSENKILLQFNHRTLAILLFIFSSYKMFKLKKLDLPRHAQNSINYVFLALLTQICMGIIVVLNAAHRELRSLHQIGAMTVLTSFLYALHSCKKPHLAHLKNILKRMKEVNPEKYKELMHRKKVEMPEMFKRIK